MKEHPFRVKFQGERAIDIGGVARYVFGINFYEEVYQQMFEGGSVMVPAILLHIDTSKWSLLGTIISHAYLICGILPIRIAFPCLSSVLLHHGDQVPQEVVFETFVDSLVAFTMLTS